MQCIVAHLNQNSYLIPQLVFDLFSGRHPDDYDVDYSEVDQ